MFRIIDKTLDLVAGLIAIAILPALFVFLLLVSAPTPFFPSRAGR